MKHGRVLISRFGERRSRRVALNDAFSSTFHGSIMYGTFSARPRGQAGQARHAKRLGQAGVLALILAGFALAAVGVNSGLVSTETELMAIYPMGPNESPREVLEKAGVRKAPDGSPHEVLGPYIGRERRPWRAATRTDHRARPRPGSFVSRQVAHEAVGLAEVGTWRPSPDQREGPAGHPLRRPEADVPGATLRRRCGHGWATTRVVRGEHGRAPQVSPSARTPLSST